ncbi:MAG: leucine-rich repeat protein [Spirochaetales bacterium]|nr:leucine-rich repeat protein [Spirochaetales bacterium]
MKKKIMVFSIVLSMFYLVTLTSCEEVGMEGTSSVVFQSVIQTGGTSEIANSTGLTLSFDVDPTSLTEDNITVTGATKGALSGSGTTRSIGISDITVANGETVSVEITNPTGYSISGSPQTAVVYTGSITYFEFQSAVQTGGTSGDASSTGLTLSFDADPNRLTADNITVTGATKGALSGSGTTRSLGISNITVANGETVSVEITNPTGYSISGSPQTAVVYKGPSVTLNYNYDGAESSIVSVTKGEAFDRPDPPGRSGYCFYHWYSDENLTTEYDFDDSVTTDTTIYAKWIAIDDSSIPDITTVDSSTTYGPYAYVSSGNTSESSYIIPASYDNYSVKVIGKDAFIEGFGQDYNANTTLKSVEICYGVERIGEDAFYKCENLTSIELPESVNYMGSYAFYGSGLTSVPFVSGVTYGGGQCFGDCLGLTSVVIPDNITSIGTNMFSLCTNITSITIGSGLSKLPERAFAGTAITSIDIPDNINSIGNQVFFQCKKLNSVTLGTGLTEIGQQTFYECTVLKSISIPDGVKTIGKYAFSYCYKLESVEFPTSIETIGDGAFKKCTSLTSFTCPRTTPPALGEDVFTNVNSSCVIYVPSGSVNTYKNADGWSTWKDLIQSI